MSVTNGKSTTFGRAAAEFNGANNADSGINSEGDESPSPMDLDSDSDSNECSNDGEKTAKGSEKSSNSGDKGKAAGSRNSEENEISGSSDNDRSPESSENVTPN